MTGPRRACTLDAKKRLTIPSEWRELVKTSGFVYVIAERPKCLMLLPPAEMDQRMEKVRQMPLVKGSVSLLSKVAEFSEHVKMDPQGRIRICDRLLEFAEIEDKAVAVPAMDRLLLWSPARAPAEKPVDVDELMMALEELGI
ncbi:MAG: hypothetical protein FWH21_08355 [Kiritimatiellaeota bacterium]|nr:hypothetical protein [Kiritimatiellota bacterium]